MLLLAGFVISATAIIAIGAFTALQTGSTQLTERTNRPLVDLFLNTRTRAISFFDLVTENDTAHSVQDNLDGYLFSQHQTARSMSVQLNASLAGNDTIAPTNESAAFLDDHDNDGTDEYANRSDASQGANDPDGKLWSHKGETCFGGMEYDGTNDGLITTSEGKVVGAIYWIEVQGVDTELEEFIVIDVPGTSVPASC